MKIKHLFPSILAGLMVLVSCTENQLGDPSVNLLSDSVVSVPTTGGQVEISFTSTTAWELKDIENYADWLSPDKNSGKGSAETQMVTLTLSPNQEADRQAFVTIYAASFAKTTVTINQAGDKGDGYEAITVAEFLEKKSTEQVYKLTGKIGDIATSSKYYGFSLNDGTAEVSCPFPENWDEYSSALHTGSTVSIVGTYSYYESKQQDQVKNAKIIEHTPADASSAETVTVAQMIQKADKFNRYRLKGKVAGDVDKEYCSFDLEDETGTIKVYTVNNAAEWSETVAKGGTVTLVGAYTLYNGTVHEIVDCDIEDFEAAVVEKGSAEGVVVAVSSNGFILKTSEGYQYVFDADFQTTVSVGDNVAVNGDKDVHNGVPQLVNYEVKVNSSGNSVEHPAATVLAGEGFDSYDTVFGYVKFTGKLTISGNYYNVVVTGASAQGSISYPKDINAEYKGKVIDIEGYYVGNSGTSTTYKNIVYTKVALSDDQAGADEPVKEPEAKEDEVLYKLSNAEVVSAISSGSGYAQFTIASASGEWVANINAKQEFLQFRNSQGSYIQSPVFKTNVTRVVFSVNSKTTNGRTIYAVPSDTVLPTDKDTKYSEEQWASNYGSVTPQGKVEENCELVVSGDVKDFKIIVAGGAIYVDAIYVFCKK